MQFEHRGTTIELFLVGIHHPNHPQKIWEEARAIWKIVINGKENSGTRSGNRDEVLATQKKFIDWLIDDPDMTQIF
jgi:CHAT domain-containing protein